MKAGVFVGGIVVQNHVNLQNRLYVGIDLLEKLQPLNVPMALLVLRDDRAIENVDCRKQRGRPVAFVILGQRFCPSALERQPWLCAVQCLATCLFSPQHNITERSGRLMYSPTILVSFSLMRMSLKTLKALLPNIHKRQRLLAGERLL